MISSTPPLGMEARLSFILAPEVFSRQNRINRYFRPHEFFFAGSIKCQAVTSKAICCHSPASRPCWNRRYRQGCFMPESMVSGFFKRNNCASHPPYRGESQASLQTALQGPLPLSLVESSCHGTKRTGIKYRQADGRNIEYGRFVHAAQGGGKYLYEF